MRVEDDRLVRGRGRFADDLNQPRQAVGWFVRSSVAHATIARLDVAQARAAPGVLRVLTGAEIEAAGVSEYLAASAARRTQRRRAGSAAAACARQHAG